MANTVKQIAIFEKGDGTSQGQWVKKDIGAKAENISVDGNRLGQGTVQEVLEKIVPQNGFTAGKVIKANTDGSLTNGVDENKLITTDNVNSNIDTYLQNLNNSGREGETALRNIIEQYITVSQTTFAEVQTWVQNTLYPIGSIYISMTERDPFQQLGFGTWARIKNKVLVDKDNTGVPENNQIPNTGSMKPTINVTRSQDLSIANHKFVPTGSYNIKLAKTQATGYGVPLSERGFKDRLIVSASSTTNKINFTGNQLTLQHSITAQPEFTAELDNKIFPPYQDVYIWQRTE